MAWDAKKKGADADHMVALGPDGRQCAVAAATLLLFWDLQTGKLRCVLVRYSEGDGEADT